MSVRTSLCDISNTHRPKQQVPQSKNLQDQVAQLGQAAISLKELKALLPICKQSSAQTVLQQHNIPEKLTGLLNAEQDRSTLIFSISCLANIISVTKPKNTSGGWCRTVARLVSLLDNSNQDVASLSTQCITALLGSNPALKKEFGSEGGQEVVLRALQAYAKQPLSNENQLNYKMRDNCFSNKITYDRECEMGANDTLVLHYMKLLKTTSISE
eukprot:TRINITY_DN105136_c0_g1_i1.p1 TRINITY_DN105136_c0_g1~~TRINITY_DN105136_c0_g1_i1.p1  ORF type:complete len:214 (+),score=15.67 TRINITY_DN105136_c0_g1_i1:48-689(+)